MFDVKRLESLALELLPDRFFLEVFLCLLFSMHRPCRGISQCAFGALLCLLDAVKNIMATCSPFTP
ncbi:hypothetical protein OIU77_017790, partial [Salix suchowensis]